MQKSVQFVSEVFLLPYVWTKFNSFATKGIGYKMNARIPSKTRAEGGSWALNLRIHLNSTIFHPPPPPKKLTPKFPPIQTKWINKKKNIFHHPRDIDIIISLLAFLFGTWARTRAGTRSGSAPHGTTTRTRWTGWTGVPARPARSLRPRMAVTPTLPKASKEAAGPKGVFWLQNVTTFFGTSPPKKRGGNIWDYTKNGLKMFNVWGEVKPTKCLSDKKSQGPIYPQLANRYKYSRYK